ncbi:phosphopantetheine-binding protein [Cohnella soli]|uniref:Phosphopantetheine-binding protein n=1 Tax=Cohnella soli TaxID=425005 RepID=A0ABW0I1D6_9BACL
MLTEKMMIDTVQKICGDKEATLETRFQELDMDSTNVIEILVELEIALNIDILDDSLNLDNFSTLKDAFDYISRIVAKTGR